jgi:hypothetical protein
MPDYPDLPVGLEYEPVVRASEICPNCYGAVALGGRMIRPSRDRRVGLFRHYFANETGVCLHCAQAWLGQIVAAQYARTEESIDALDKLKQANQDNDARKVAAIADLSLIVDRLNDFVELTSRTIAGLRAVEVQYVVPPTENLSEDSRNARNQADAAEATEEAGS